MTESMRVAVWFRRGVALLLGICLLLGAVLYISRVPIVQSLLDPIVEVRGGVIELESIEVRGNGLLVCVNAYREGKLYVENARVAMDWSQLWEVRNGFAGHVTCARITQRIGSVSKGPPRQLPDPSPNLEELAATLANLPVQEMHLKIDQFVVESGRQSYTMAISALFVESSSGSRYLTIDAESAHFEGSARVDIDQGGKGLAVDFVTSLREWDWFENGLLGSRLEVLGDFLVDVQIQPLDSSSAFLDASGYLRWRASSETPSAVTILANLGTIECVLRDGAATFKESAFGLASDIANRTRVYGRGEIDSAEVKSWEVTQGDWELKIEGDRVGLELRLNETMDLSVAHNDGFDLMAGSGAGRYSFEGAPVDLGLVMLFPDLIGLKEASAHLPIVMEGMYELNDWTVSAVDGEAVLAGGSIDAPSVFLSLEQIDGRAIWEFRDAALYNAELSFQIGAIDWYDLEMEQTYLEASGGFQSIQIGPFSSQLLGGSLIGDLFELPSKPDEPVRFKVQVNGIEMEALAEIIPQFNGELSGRLSGQIWLETDGEQWRLEGGQLVSDEGSVGRLSYDIEGLLTSGLNPESAAFARYWMAKKAFQDLELSRLAVDVFPEGDTQRLIQVKLYGESEQDGTMVPVDYTLNVNVDDAENLIQLLRRIHEGELTIE